MGRGIALLAVIISAGLGSAAPALGAPAFLTPGDISVPGTVPAQDAAATHVAMDAAGDTFATWFRSDASNQIVQAAVRPAGGSFAAPQNLSAPGADAAAPVIAADFGGDATVSWYRFNGTNYIVQASYRPAGGAFGAAVDLSSGGQDARFPSVAMDPVGNVLVTWVRFNGTNFIVQASYKPVAGSFSGPIDLSAPNQDATDAHPVLDNFGNAIVTWERSDGSNNIVQYALRPVGGNFASAVNLSVTGKPAQDSRVAFDPSGNAYATWQRFDGSNYIVQSSFRPAGGGFGNAKDVGTAGAAPGEPPRVAFDPSGNALLTFTASDGTNQIAQVAYSPAGGSNNFGTPVGLSAAGQDAHSPEVVFDASGNGIVTWFRATSGSNYVQAAVRPPGGSFGAVQNISAANSQGQDMAVDPFGNGVLTWQHYNGAHLVIQAMGVDGAGPQLRGLSVPASGFVGQPLSFAVAPLDVWSAVGATSWNFGDGVNTAGTTVSHTYTAPGTYTARVASVDALGNVSISPPASVQILPSPVPPRPAAASIGTLSFNGRVLSVPISCANQTCNGRLNVLAFDDGATIAAKKKKKKRHRQFTVATARFSIPAGQTKTLKLTVSSKARSLLAKKRRLPIVLQLKLDGQSATRTPATLHAKGKKKTTKKKK